MRRIDLLNARLGLLFATDPTVRGSDESSSAQTFIQKVHGILAGDPKVLGYMGFMYAQAAYRYHPIIKSIATDLCSSLVKSLDDETEVSSTERLKERLTEILEEYDDYRKKAHACLFPSNKWLSSYVNGIDSLLSSENTTIEDKEALTLLKSTIPYDIQYHLHSYKNTTFSCTNRIGTVSIGDEAVAPSLFLSVGDYINDARIVRLTSTQFFTDINAAYSVSYTIPGYSKVDISFARITITDKDQATFLSLLPFVEDRSDKYIQHGILLYGSRAFTPLSDTVEYGFSQQTVAAYRNLKKAEVDCDIDGGLEILVDSQWSASDLGFLVNTKLYESAGAAMELVDTRRYR